MSTLVLSVAVSAHPLWAFLSVSFAAVWTCLNIHFYASDNFCLSFKFWFSLSSLLVCQFLGMLDLWPTGRSLSRKGQSAALPYGAKGRGSSKALELDLNSHFSTDSFTAYISKCYTLVMTTGVEKTHWFMIKGELWVNQFTQSSLWEFIYCVLNDHIVPKLSLYKTWERLEPGTRSIWHSRQIGLGVAFLLLVVLNATLKYLSYAVRF